MTDQSSFSVIPSSNWIASSPLSFAIFDKYPVSAGHALVIPKRVVSTWWELSQVEQHDLIDLVSDVKILLDVHFNPEGYNVGFNSGPAAGQTVDHVHVHVIPRIRGDVPDPTGGVRGVIPHKANYLNQNSDNAIRSTTSYLVDAADSRTLKLEIYRSLINETFDRVDFLVSFIMDSGLNLIHRHLETALQRGAKVRILTTDYMYVTHPAALTRILDLQSALSNDKSGDSIELRVFHDPGTSFHPKAYVFWSAADGHGIGFVGSNNLSKSGIDGGIEWSTGTTDVAPLRQSFDALWDDTRSIEIDEAWVRDYAERRPKTEPIPVSEVDEPTDGRPQPHEIQREALAALELTRANGFQAGLVVMATGLGKTLLAAFDTDRPEFGRILFVAHRDEILNQARTALRRVHANATIGYFTGTEKTLDAKITMAGVRTLSRNLERFEPDEFDYIVVDEFHHAAAPSYRKVLNYFHPRFLLGLTATPSRMDNADLLALCGDNLVFDCDLVAGIEHAKLVPFRYWGIADTIDFAPLPWRNGRFDPTGLEAAAITEERAAAALREWQKHAGERTLAFCVSIKHAEYMAKYFRSLGIAALALHSESSPALRQRAIDQIEDGELKVLFTVDLFNEGVDLPALDTVLMLRPTQSPIVFLQQIGRGLRISESKTHLDVIDFVGNHKSFLSPLRTLLSLRLGRAPTSIEMKHALDDLGAILPPGCSLDYDVQAIDLLNELLNARSAQGATDALREIVVNFHEEHGYRPSALQTELAGGNVAAARRRSGSWFSFLSELDLLGTEELEALADAPKFLTTLETTSMTKSFKMVTVQALLSRSALIDGGSIPAIADESLSLIQKDPRLRADVDSTQFSNLDVVDTNKWERYWRKNPIDAWAGSDLFTVNEDRIEPEFSVRPSATDSLNAMVAELTEWRLHGYFMRSRSNQSSDSSASMTLPVSHSGGAPIIRFDRKRFPQIPQGAHAFIADGNEYSGRFAKIALNVATLPDSSTNDLHSLLRGWFGPAAGHPGSNHKVRMNFDGQHWFIEPMSADGNAIRSTLRFFPTYEVACGDFDTARPLDSSDLQIPIKDIPAPDTRDFVVCVRGDSMSGTPTSLVHGDLVRLRWVKGQTLDQLTGKAVLVELSSQGETRAALKTLIANPNGYILRSTATDYDDIPADHSMNVVAEFVERIDPSRYDPLSSLLGQPIRREDIAPYLGVEFNVGNWNSGIVAATENEVVIFVTLSKEANRKEESHLDYFEDQSTFHWTSQTAMKPDSKKSRDLLGALEDGRRIHLFVRKKRSDVAFIYAGLVAPLRHEGSQPMTIWFRLLTHLEPELVNALGGIA